MVWLPALPPQPFQVRPLVDVRLRYERRVNRDLSDATNDDSTVGSLRARVGLEAQDARKNVVRFVFQHTRSRDERLAGASEAQTFDTLELNVAAPLAGGKATVGRQRLKKGESRLFGLGDWSIKSRSWDAIRYTGGRWDVFVGQLGVATTQNREARVGLASYESAWGETMLVHKQDTRPAQSVQNWTLDHRAVVKRGRATLPIEGAVQVGRQNDRFQRAYMLTLRPTLTVAPGVDAYLQADVASGGRSSGVSRLFDQLYASLMNTYSFSESLGQRNVRVVAAGVDWKPTKALELRAKWQRFELYDRRDGWYGSSGSLVRRPGGGDYIDPTGASGRHIGDELGMLATWAIDKRSSVQGGFSVLTPGTFVKVMNAGSATRQVWGYLALQYRF